MINNSTWTKDIKLINGYLKNRLKLEKELFHDVKSRFYFSLKNI